jgi:hypothetical protein
MHFVWSFRGSRRSFPWGKSPRRRRGALNHYAPLGVRYEKDREQLTAWEGPKAAKGRFAAQLEERHQREREPYVQRLSDLQYRAIIS